MPGGSATSFHLHCDWNRSWRKQDNMNIRTIRLDHNRCTGGRQLPPIRRESSNAIRASRKFDLEFSILQGSVLSEIEAFASQSHEAERGRIFVAVHDAGDLEDRLRSQRKVRCGFLAGLQFQGGRCTKLRNAGVEDFGVKVYRKTAVSCQFSAGAQGGLRTENYALTHW